ncbi:MAG: ribosome maturation factor RimM [bacterium]
MKSRGKIEARDGGFSALGKIGRPQGNRGEVRLQPYDLSPDLIQRARGVKWWVQSSERDDLAPLTVDDLWFRKGQIICKFQGVDDISAAEALRDAEVFLRDEDRPPLMEGEYYDTDLVGLKVVSHGDGAELGVIKEIQFIAGQDLLVIENEKGEFLIPAVKKIVQKVDFQRREVVVDLPEGLQELNKND